jgi:hypothetical protein
LCGRLLSSSLRRGEFPAPTLALIGCAGLRGKRQLFVAGQARRFHHVDHHLVHGELVGIDDHHRRLPAAPPLRGRLAQACASPPRRGTRSARWLMV